jgi:hypothetical protein
MMMGCGGIVSAQIRGGNCIRDTLPNLNLKKDEQDFIKNVLDRIPIHTNLRFNCDKYPAIIVFFKWILR